VTKSRSLIKSLKCLKTDLPEQPLPKPGNEQLLRKNVMILFPTSFEETSADTAYFTKTVIKIRFTVSYKIQ
jgi:hypothetical protein